MATYVRIVDGVVMESFVPPVGSGLVPGLEGLLNDLPGEWMALSPSHAKTVGDNWTYDGSAFAAPAPAPAPAPVAAAPLLSKAEILARIEALTALAQSLPDDTASSGSDYS
jgi:hypothetical protein